MSIDTFIDFNNSLINLNEVLSITHNSFDITVKIKNGFEILETYNDSEQIDERYQSIKRALLRREILLDVSYEGELCF